MTSLKTNLISPEQGWRRYGTIELTENVEMNAIFKELRSDSNTLYTDSRNGNKKNELMLSFSFVGTGIRIISYLGSDRSTNLRIIIDGKEHIYSEVNSGYVRYGLCFDLSNLENSTHKVEMYSGTNGTYSNFMLAAIDLEGESYIIPKQKNIGDQLMIPQLNWIRYDDRDPIIKHIGEKTQGTNSLYYNLTYTDYKKEGTGFEIVTDKVSKIRIIGNAFGVGNNNGSKEFYVEVDGALKGTFTTRLLTGTVTQILLAEVELPDNGEHTIKVYRGSEGLYFTLDAIDLYTNPVEYKHLLYKDGEYGYISDSSGVKIKIDSSTAKFSTSHILIDSRIKLENLFDGIKYDDFLSRWMTDNIYSNEEVWVSIEFLNPRKICSYIIYPSCFNTEFFTDWEFQVFKEEEWVTIDKRENIKFEEKTSQKFDIENPLSYSKYRILIPVNTHNVGKIVAMQELELIEEGLNFKSLGTSLPTDEQFEQYGATDLTEWLPFINEIQGEKKIITKASEPLQSLNINYLPETQFIKQNDFIKINKETLGALSINEGQTKGNIRVAAQFPDVDTFSYVFKDNTWSKIAVTDATVFSENGNTIDEMNLADWSTSPLNQQVRFIYTMKMNDIKDSVILSSIDIKLKGVVSSTPVIKKAISLIKAYTFNGYLENIERLNTINFEKLEFKSDSLINAQQNQMHNLVIDVFNSDSVQSISSSNTSYEDMNVINNTQLGESFLYEFPIDDEDILGVES